ncbi:hypothetical protein LXL04_019436 [Taraxacum kok-saghyz]
MATYKLATIIRNCTNNDEFLLVKQTPPPKYDDQEYDSFADSTLWDLPSAKLTSLSPESDSSTQFVLQGWANDLVQSLEFHYCYPSLQENLTGDIMINCNENLTGDIHLCINSKQVIDSALAKKGRKSPIK